MATLVWKKWENFDLRKLNLYNVQNAYEYHKSSDKFVADYWNGMRDEFRGVGFTYGADGYPTGGTVKAYYLKGSFETYGYITGLNISATSLVAAARTPSKIDDIAIFKAALSRNDIIKGGEGDDKLEGFAGNDKIVGGWGRDKLYGGKGKDTFIYKSSYDAAWENGGDVIFDFSRRQGDKIDLRAVDADSITEGRQSFHFIGTQAFSGKAGELRYENVSDGIMIYGDDYGAGEGEIVIHLKKVSSVTQSDFYL